jgi:pantetheine-phosphate adenylyltransferase
MFRELVFCTLMPRILNEEEKHEALSFVSSNLSQRHSGPWTADRGQPQMDTSTTNYDLFSPYSCYKYYLMKRIALFPGTFDPITVGHVNILERAIPLFDEIVIGIGNNSSKSTLFALEQREQWIKDIFKDVPTIKVASYEGLTVDFCKEINAHYILRGLRNMSDFDYEKNIAQMNKLVSENVESIFLMCDPAYTPISSSVVRDLIRNGGDTSKFLPEEVKF